MLSIHRKREREKYKVLFDLCTGIFVQGCFSQDVSALGEVHTLRLYWCSGITDASALGGDHTLTLYDCSGITDVSALGGVHTLSLRACCWITDVSALG